MQHIFDVDIAVKYGMDVATFIKNMSFWIVKNQANNVHFHDGRYWTYNKIDAFTLIFPYWSKDQIRRIIIKCVNYDLIVKGNYNKSGYDQTLWYSLSDLGHKLLNIDIIPNRHSDLAKSLNGIRQTANPIPYINTDNKQQIKDKRITQPKKQVAFCPLSISLPDWLSKEIWKEFCQHRKDIKKPMTSLAAKKAISLLEKMRSEGQDIDKVIDTCIANGWQGLYPLKEGSYNGKSNGNTNQKSDWQIDYFKQVLGGDIGGELGFGTPNTSSVEIDVSTKDELQLQDSRRFKQSSNSLDESFDEYNTRRYLESLG